METHSTPKVYAAINAVMADIAKEGIGKDRKNEQQNYKFRGIDDVYNALAPILSRNHLIVLPRVLSRQIVERTNAKGTALFYVTVETEFDLISGEDGSKHTIKTYGEAMDSGDKATNKAMSAAYKYAAMQAFCIPTEGDNDADSQTHGDIVRGNATALTKAKSDIAACLDDPSTRKWWADRKDGLAGVLSVEEMAEAFDAVKARLASFKKPAPANTQEAQFDEVA